MRVPLMQLVLSVLIGLGAVGSSATELQAQGEPISLNFVDARLSDVIRSLSAALGVNVVITGVPDDRRVTVATTVPVDVAELGSFLESILEANQLVLVQKGSIAQVVPVEDAPATGVIR